MSAALLRVPSPPAFLSVSRAREQLARATRVLEAKHVKDIAEAMRVWARAQKDGGDAQRQAAEIVLRASRRMGELSGALEKAPRNATGPRLGPVKRAALADVGLTKQDASRLEALAKVPEETFEKYVAQTKEEVTTAGALRLLHASAAEDYDGDEWYTPPEVIAVARASLGEIDLDPTSSAHAQKTVGAARFYTKRDDGLAQPWTGRVFCNPPYSTALVQAFTKKFLAEVDSGRCRGAVYLVNNCTDAAWFHDLLARFPVCFTRGRIAFLSRKGQAFATRQGQAIFLAGTASPKPFRALGTIVVPQ